MTALDWAVVLVLNGGIVAYSLIAFRNKGESFDWYLAAKSMPWWMIGLSAFGTAVDSGDYVGIVGGSYNLGLSQLAQWWLGIAVGWTVLSFFVIVPMYRSGVFTNAEWLEFRFGPAARLLAVLINVQSRTNVLGNIFFSMFLVLNVITGIEETTCWLVVVGVALSSVLYIVRGGLRAGVLTDALQSATMIVASFVLWGFVYSGLGGWDGVAARLEAVEEGLADTLLHVGGYSPPGVPPFIVIFGFLVVLTTYAVINQYEAIRFLGARSEWDFKMAALVASIATAICLFFNVSLGPMARAQFPGLEMVDQAYPLMIKAYLPAGLVGLVVAGLVAAGYSTFDSIGIGISSLFVRDVYARFIVKDATDAHYTKVGRISVPVILALGFIYVPFLGEKGMLLFYLRLAGAIAVPLMTVILMGVFYASTPRDRDHRFAGGAWLRDVGDLGRFQRVAAAGVVPEYVVDLPVELGAARGEHVRRLEADRLAAWSSGRRGAARTDLQTPRGPGRTAPANGPAARGAGRHLVAENPDGSTHPAGVSLSRSARTVLSGICGRGCGSGSIWPWLASCFLWCCGRVA